MDLQTTGSADQVRQGIEGNLQTDRDRDISSTLVILTESAMISTVLSLADSGGVFLETEATYRAHHDERGPETEDSGATQKALEETQQALTEIQHELEKAATACISGAGAFGVRAAKLSWKSQHQRELLRALEVNSRKRRSASARRGS
jgi:hypothetical protein